MRALALFFTRGHVKGRDVFGILWALRRGFPGTGPGIPQPTYVAGRRERLPGSPEMAGAGLVENAASGLGRVSDDVQPFLPGGAPSWFRPEEAYRILNLSAFMDGSS